MGDEENEGYHKNLIEASAKELEMFMEIQALDLEKRRAASQTVEKPHQAYIDGMALPNSSGIAEILPVRRGSKELVKSDKLFQKQQLSQLYVVPGQANHDDDADLIPRFDFRNRLQSSQPELEVERAPTPPPEPEPVVVETSETKVELEEIASPPPAPVVVPPQKYNPMYDWRADDSDSEVESPPPAVAAPVPKAVKTKKPKRFRPGQPNIDLDDIVSNDGEPRSRGIFGDEATKKLIKIHGVEELPHPAARHAKKKKEKKKVAPKRQDAAASVPLLKTVVEEKPTIVSDVDALVEEPQPLSLTEASVTPPQSAKKQKPREPLFEPRRFVKLPEAIPMPRIPPKIIKSTSKLNRPDFKLSERVVRAMSLRSSDEPFELKKSFPKGQLQHSSLDSVSIETVKPILSVLTNASASLSQPITIDSISAIVTNQFKSKDSTKITEAIQALVSLHTMFKDDVKEKKQFDTFVAPMLDAYLSDDVVIRHQVVRSLVDMEIRHDDVLALLICALNERDHSLVQTAIKGLANYGVADKEGLKRAMIELGMIHGKAKYTSNEKLEQLADKIQRDATKQQMERLSMTSNWIKENDLPALTLTRHDSYFEHLAGPFFPPDAHDFDGKQRYLVLATESNVNYDQYWKEKYMAKLHQDESSIEVFKWDENSSRRHTLSRASHLTEMIQIRQMISTMLPGKKGKQTPRTNAPGPHASQKAKSSAHMALAITRAMARGLVPNELQASSFPKLRPVTSHNSRASDASIPLLVVPMQHGKPAPRRPHTTANAGSGTLLEFHLVAKIRERPNSAAGCPQMFGLKKRPKDTAPKPSNRAFWISAFAGANRKRNSRDRTSSEESLDELSTTISTIHIEENEEKDPLLDGLEKEPDTASGQDDTASRPAPEPRKWRKDPLAVAWSSPTKVLPQIQPLHDESSSEFQVHVADTSLMHSVPALDAAPAHDGLAPSNNLQRSPLVSAQALVVETELQTRVQISSPSVPPLSLDKPLLPPIELAEHPSSALYEPLPRKPFDEPPAQQQLEWQQDEYEARLQYAKEESKNYILTIRDELDYSLARIQELEAENDKLHSICEQYEAREEQANATMNSMALDIDELRSAWEDSNDGKRELEMENKRLRQAVEELSQDLALVSSRLELSKKQSVQQEADFEMFARKIKSQQALISELEEEKSQLTISLRLLVREFKHENDQLRAAASHTAKPAWPASPVQDATRRISSEIEGQEAAQSLKAYEEGAELPTPSSPVPSRSHLSPSRSLATPAGGGQAAARPPSKELRRFVMQSMSSPEDVRSAQSRFKDSYYERKDVLEKQLLKLADEKKKLAFELSRVPSTGVKALKRQGELESLLDEIDRQMSSTRRQMKNHGLL
ncbi:hypothetical protein HDU91_006131 [Kappamyces sp. JEL0680]|nr:hypothetical protein HDU91_006131 [Kappamyces sp. JEL0680]